MKSVTLVLNGETCTGEFRDDSRESNENHQDQNRPELRRKRSASNGWEVSTGLPNAGRVELGRPWDTCLGSTESQ